MAHRSLRGLFERIVVLAVLMCLAHACSTPVAGGDSESHFLQDCSDSCAPGLECVCGVCTRRCGAKSACDGLAGNAQCASFVDGACEAAETVCDVACADDDACRAIGANARCQQGRCRLPAPVSGSRNAGGGGRAGTSAPVDASSGGTLATSSGGGKGSPLPARGADSGSPVQIGSGGSNNGQSPPGTAGKMSATGGTRVIGDGGATARGLLPDSGTPLDGAASVETCSVGIKFCGGLCTPPAPRVGCGLTGCDPCTLAAPPNGYITCSNGECAFDCLSGYTKIGGSCAPNGAAPSDAGSAVGCDPVRCPQLCTVVFGPVCCTTDGHCGCPQIPYVAPTCIRQDYVTTDGGF